MAFDFEVLEPRDVPAADYTTLPVLPGADPVAGENARAIVARGEQLGRNESAFLRAGDSNSADVPSFDLGFLTPLGEPGYDPVASGLKAAAPQLVATLNRFLGPVDTSGANSFDRVSTAAYPGWKAGNVLAALPGEIAATNAGIAFVMVGTNDFAPSGDVSVYRAELASIVGTLTAAGVLPILSTLPDVTHNPALTPLLRTNNQVIADTAAEFHVPLWNLYPALVPLPAAGLGPDGIHLNKSPDGAASFTPADLRYGENTRNLEALTILNWFQNAIVNGSPDPLPLSPNWTPLAAGQPVFAVGDDVGQGSAVRVFDAARTLIDQFQAFEPSFTGGVRVAVADVNGDGIPDVVAVPGSGGGPVVKVFSGADGSLLASFYAFDPGFRGGFTVAAGDLDGDGKAEIVVGAGPAGGPQVVVFRGGDFAPVQSFYAFNPAFRGGVNVAVGTFDGYGPAIVAGAGDGGGPVVELFRYGSDTALTSNYAFPTTSRGGVAVAAGSLGGGGGDVLVTASGGGSPQVVISNPASGKVEETFTAGNPKSGGGAQVAVAGGMLLVGNGSPTTPGVLVYAGLSLAPAATIEDARVTKV